MAYFFASMPGLVIVQTIIFGETIDKYYNSSGLFLFCLLIAAYFCIIKALEIYETIDVKQEEEAYERAINKIS